MTKTTSNIVVKYKDYYKAWLTAHNERAGYEKESKLLMAVDVIESILINDCGLGVKKVSEIRNSALDEFYSF